MMWRPLTYVLAALLGVLSGLIASVITPLITCCCCGPVGGVLSGAAACAVPPGASRPEASRVGVLSGLAFGVGAFIGLLLATLLGLATGAIQRAQEELLRQLGQSPAPGETTMGLAVGILIVLCIGALLLLPLSAAGGWLGGRIVLSLRGEAS
ncbi:hypothetical protein [Thermoflexus hugenholtzii]|jgi:hypothetical protein|uniref:Uncharacterized protein n=1 Tax=Thermoflexus hugenholtzii JAD2 TaxID=877466 RepID=A0A212QHW2_9CHLR|nr:hypothetical protein [Thermoflexus hugenholtzii]SNB58956.1 hypothetical protein SAMN02746019_00024440 [Thermoflexus hugenholtzii JAD2]